MDSESNGHKDESFMKTASQGISLLWLLLLVACTTANAPDTPAEKKFAQMTYSTPEGAVSALGTAYARDEMKDISEILGDEGHRLISSGDPVIDRQEANWFRSLYKEGHEVELQGNAQAILNLGRVGQRYPIPLVKEAGLWRFDTIVGHEDLLSRRISKS
jgi:hypothetical protein